LMVAPMFIRSTRNFLTGGRFGENSMVLREVGGMARTIRLHRNVWPVVVETYTDSSGVSSESRRDTDT